MPDLTIEHYYECITASHDEANVGGYVQLLAPTPQGPCQYGWSCTCKGFQFRGKCKHIAIAEENACGWMQFTDGGEPNKGECPNCGKRAVSRGWGV